MGFSYLAEYTANRELRKLIESLGDSAKEQLDESIIRYSNARLVQEIGKASSISLAIDALLKNLMRVMQSHLRYDRGLIMLADREETWLTFAAGFGYSGEETSILRQTGFDLANPDAQNLFVVTFKTQRPLLAKKSNAANTIFAPKVNKIFEKIGLEETVCVPLVYENQALGILAVDDLVSKSTFTESDMNLLQGIASQIAIGLNHAALFEKLQQSQQKFRQTLENIEEGYFEVDLKGNFTFVNTPLGAMTGYSCEELTRMRYDDFAASDTARQMYHVFNRIYRTGESLKFAEFDVIKKNGTSLSVELSASLMKNSAGDTVGFRGIICDISERLETEEERRKLETHLQQIQKLESIGKLASGIAHNLNNMLMGIQGNSSLLRLEIDPEDRTSKRIADIENIIENASKLIGQIHGYARGGKFKINTVNLK